MGAEGTGSAGRIAHAMAHRRGKWAIVAFWFLITFVALVPAGKLSGAQDNDIESWLPSDAESTAVLKATQPFFDSNEFPTLVVYERSAGITPSDLEYVQGQIAEINALDHIARPVVPELFDPAKNPEGSIIPAKDGQALLVNVPIDAGSDGWELVADVVKEMKETTSQTSADGLTGLVTGVGGYTAEQAEAFAGIDGILLGAAMLVVITILLFSYRSPVLWVLPVVSALVALIGAQAVIYSLVEFADLTVNGQSFGILTVLVFGAGTDYALLLVARYREELRRHEDKHEAMAVALHRAAPAIIASGLTVVAGMLCLLLASMESTKGLGPVSAVGIAVGLVVMLTLLPALMVACPRKVFWPQVPTYGSADQAESGIWARMGQRIARAPRRTWVVTSVVLAAFSFGVLVYDYDGLKQSEQYYGKPEPVRGEEILAKHFDAGQGTPLDIVTTPDRADAVAEVVAGDPGIASVTPARIADGTAYLAATLNQAPDSRAAEDTVERLREDLDAVSSEALVGGQTALFNDIMRASAYDNKVVVPAVLLVVFVILAGLLRALVAPLILMGTVVLSFGAALGASTLLFKYVFGFADADPGLPLFVFIFLVALGIDYNIFLMTRVHEEAKRWGTRRGALIGLGATGGVITSAGLVLAGTFAALGTMPVVAFAQIGVAVCLGVLLDTIIVRAVLVTALNLDFGRVMWWPSAMWKSPLEFQDGASREPDAVSTLDQVPSAK